MEKYLIRLLPGLFWASPRSCTYRFAGAAKARGYVRSFIDDHFHYLDRPQKAISIGLKSGL